MLKILRHKEISQPGVKTGPNTPSESYVDQIGTSHDWLPRHRSKASGKEFRAMKSAQLGISSKILRKPWYWFWRFVVNKLYNGREYTLHVPDGYRTLTPWFTVGNKTSFSTLIQSVHEGGPLATSLDRCYQLYQFARRSAFLDGDMAECGVYTGGTAHLLALTLDLFSNTPAHLHLFDTFGGMPDCSDPQRDYHSPGDFSDTSLSFVKQRLDKYSSACVFHPGVMPDTFAEVDENSRFSFVHVDVDNYPSVVACCRWFWPRLVSGGAMIFGDYGMYPYRHAARAAVDEFFAHEIEKPLVLPTGQALLLKR